MSDLDEIEASSVSIEDPTSGDNLAVNPGGSVNVVLLNNPPAPANTTPVVISAFGDVGDTTGVDTFYTITNGDTLTIQTLLAGSEETAGGAIVELFHDPNGNLSVLTRLSTEFVNGASDSASVSQSFVGDGTARIVLRRRTYSGAAREMFAQWIGYEA